MDSSVPAMSVLFSSLVATKYTTVASATVLVWDMALTLDIEISRVWLARKSLGTTLFFLNRYIPPALFTFDLYSQFVTSPTIEVCKQYELSSTIMDLVSIAVIEAVLVMRTHALYQNRSLLALLSCLGVVSIINMLTCFLIVFRYETFIPASLIGFKGCLSGCTSSLCQPLLIAFWIPFFLLETLVFSLTAWKSYKSYTTMKLNGSSNLMAVLMRDGVLYYIVIMSVSICNFLIWIVDPFASYLAVGLLKSLQATICSRLLLNLRGMLEPKPATVSQLENVFPTQSSAMITLASIGTVLPSTDISYPPDRSREDYREQW
ncbi:hypothetical protein B0H34DRAFT_396508 [Crassisporium funariophilum]|nr:hypothetical protein B0H34DRAFT_396508 [Crassisporium funariophilum]